MGLKANIGDVFLIPLRDGGYGGGQVAGLWNDELYVIVYDVQLDSSQADPAEVVSQRPMLCALTLDAKIFHGMWPIIGNVLSNIDSIAQPYYKVRNQGVLFVESRDRSLFRPAEGEEASALMYRSVASPAIVEDVTNASLSMGEWLPGYDKFRYEYAVSSQKILG